VGGGGSYSSTGGRQFDNRQFDNSKPVFNRPGFGKVRCFLKTVTLW
jgi:hypothetical protein